MMAAATSKMRLAATTTGPHRRIDIAMNAGARRSVLLLIAIVAVCFDARAQDPPGAMIHLSGEGASYRGRLESTEADEFLVGLAPGAFLEIIVQQHGLDVVLRLFDPARGLIVESDRPNAQDGPERIAYIAALPGEYRLEVARNGTGDG